MKYWVYIHIFPNGKRYVGCTTATKPEWRWGKEGKFYGRQVVGTKIIKYGWDNIVHEVFEVNSKEEMWYLEKYLIAYYHTTDKSLGYNKSGGGENGSLGSHYTRSEEDRRKNSERNKGKIHSVEQRERQASSMRKNWENPEYREKATEARKKVGTRPEFKEKISNLSKERWKDPEYKKRLSEAHKHPHRKRT